MKHNLNGRQFIYQIYSKKLKLMKKSLDQEIKKIIKLSKNSEVIEYKIKSLKFFYQNNNSNKKDFELLKK